MQVDVYIDYYSPIQWLLNSHNLNGHCLNAHFHQSIFLTAYVRTNMYEIQARNITKWHKIKTQDREATCRGYYVPRIKKGISLAFGSASKKYASRYYQLKVEHSLVGIFLVRIEVIQTLKCWRYGVTEQIVKHLYIQYQK